MPDGSASFAEIQYFFRLRFSADEVHSLALVTLFSLPDPEILRCSSQTVYLCRYQGDMALKVVEVKTIKAVVSMVPDLKVTPAGNVEELGQFFLVEKPGLDIAELTGEEDQSDDDDNELYN